MFTYQRQSGMTNISGTLVICWFDTVAEVSSTSRQSGRTSYLSKYQARYLYAI